MRHRAPLVGAAHWAARDPNTDFVGMPSGESQSILRHNATIVYAPQGIPCRGGTLGRPRSEHQLRWKAKRRKSIFQHKASTVYAPQGAPRRGGALGRPRSEHRLLCSTKRRKSILRHHARIVYAPQGGRASVPPLRGIRTNAKNEAFRFSTVLSVNQVE